MENFKDSPEGMERQALEERHMDHTGGDPGECKSEAMRQYAEEAGLSIEVFPEPEPFSQWLVTTNNLGQLGFPEEAPMEDRTDIWQRASTTVYKLRSIGFHRGVERFENEFTVNVHGRGDVRNDLHLAQKLCNFLNSEVSK